MVKKVSAKEVELFRQRVLDKFIEQSKGAGFDAIYASFFGSEADAKLLKAKREIKQQNQFSFNQYYITSFPLKLYSTAEGTYHHKFRWGVKKEFPSDAPKDIKEFIGTSDYVFITQNSYNRFNK